MIQHAIKAAIRPRKTPLAISRGKYFCTPARNSFYELVDQTWAKHLESRSIKTPTEIQSQTLHEISEGHDLVAISPTGSGKTLCFLLPMFQDLLVHEKSFGPRALILTPTRELCRQISSEVVKLNDNKDTRNLKAAVLFGGSDREEKLMAELTERKYEVVVATPGRLIDFIQSSAIKLSDVNFLVLDEADRMLEMGFRKEVEYVISRTPKTSRQTVMFSATWPTSVRELAESHLQDPIHVEIGLGKLLANERVQQTIKFAEGAKRERDFIRDMEKPLSLKWKILVFANKKSVCDRVCELLQEEKIAAAALHGNKSQNQRNETLEAFRNGWIQVLVATDVCARGIDISDIRVVVNFDLPYQLETYVHRVGRTARGESRGASLSYVGFHDFARIGRGLAQLLAEGNQPVPRWLLKGVIDSAKQHQMAMDNGKKISHTDVDLPKYDKRLKPNMFRGQSKRSKDGNFFGC